MVLPENAAGIDGVAAHRPREAAASFSTGAAAWRISSQLLMRKAPHQH